MDLCTCKQAGCAHSNSSIYALALPQSKTVNNTLNTSTSIMKSWICTGKQNSCHNAHNTTSKNKPYRNKGNNNKYLCPVAVLKVLQERGFAACYISFNSNLNATQVDLLQTATHEAIATSIAIYRHAKTTSPTIRVDSITCIIHS